MKETTNPSCRFCCKYPLLLFAASLFWVGCNSHTDKKRQSKEYYQKLENKLKDMKDEQEILRLEKHYQTPNDPYARILCYKQLGKQQRDNARFSQAIASHQEALNLAYALADTIEIVQALNNLGTNFRRIGALAEASDYHYKALEYAEAYSGRYEKAGRKNRVISMNGIGNVNLTLGYYDEAERFFRRALADEMALESHIGQAINLANIGSIFEERQQYDSAETYYRRSMEQNRAGQSDLGIGLCYIHLGHLYKKQQRYPDALQHYTKAYQLMSSLSDRWHWLDACIAMAEIYLSMHKDAEFKQYITRAEATANNISSPEHLAQIHHLQHDFNLNRKLFKDALQHYKKSQAYEDSVKGAQKVSRYINLRIDFERERNKRNMQLVEARNRQREAQRALYLYISLAAFIVISAIALLLWYAYRQRRRSNRILAAMEQVRTNFFTGITHEFRTPITIIQGFNNELKKGNKLSQEQRRHCTQTIERQTLRLLSLVNQLLDIAHLRSGKESPQWKRADIVAYMRMGVEHYRLYAQQKKIELNFATEATAQEMDFIPFYIDKVISNLIANAIKHTPEGGAINYSIDIERGRTLILRVSDTGTGISDEDLPHIFEIFYCNDRSTDNMSTGIGLSFTRLLVEKMHGTIEVESTSTQGTVFVVRLPLYTHHPQSMVAITEEPKPKANTILLSSAALDTEPCIPARKANEATPQPAGNGNPHAPLLLIVEDNADLRRYLQMLFAPNYRLIAAADGEEGLEAAHLHMPDLIVTDVMMPRKDGISLCTELKQNVVTNHIPVVMLTARSTDEDRIAGLRCGVEAYIRKPFQTEELLITIANLLAARKLLQEKYTRMITHEAVFPTPSVAKNTADMPSAGTSQQQPDNQPPPACTQTHLARYAEACTPTQATPHGDMHREEPPSHTPYSPQTKAANTTEKANLNFLNHVIAFIDSHIEDHELTPAYVASNICLSLSQLNRKLNAITGQPVSAHILKRRLVHTRLLLDNPDYSITQIALACGFTDSSHLNRTFKKQYGITPTAYRNR